MAYYNRPTLLRKTIEAYLFFHPNLIEISEFVIVDDGSDVGLEANTVVTEYKDRIKAKVIELPKDKNSSNPAIPINISVKQSSGDIVVITNPEAMPLSPVLEHLEEACQPNTYTLVPCYSVSIENQKIVNDTPINRLKDTFPPFNNVALWDEGADAWYEHPEYIARFFYFFAAMKKDDFIKIGGIDEDFSDGRGYEDNDFVRRVLANGFQIQYDMQELVLHQNHYSGESAKIVRVRRDNCELLQKKILEGKLIANEEKDWGSI